MTKEYDQFPCHACGCAQEDHRYSWDADGSRSGLACSKCRCSDFVWDQYAWDHRHDKAEAKS